MSKLYAALIALALLADCATHHPPTPQPTPSPVPSPTPPPVVTILPPPTLLHVQGTRFINTEGKDVYLQGSGGVCCHLDPAVNLWPWVSDALLQDLAIHGANLIHIRLGPNGILLEPRANMRPYLEEPVGYSANGALLAKYNPQFFADLNKLLDRAYAFGIYVEIDLIDGWMQKDPKLSPWGADDKGCGIFKHSPKTVHADFLHRVVNELGRHSNILWQIGNETGVCGSSVDWELGVVRYVRTFETENGFPRHLIASNAEMTETDKSPQIDYLNTHQCSAPEQPNGVNKPIATNECNGVPTTGESFKHFKAQMDLAHSRGTYYQLWWSDMPDSEWAASLDAILAYRKQHP